MTDFLLELRSEEIPARMQAGARRDLEKLFRQQIADAGVKLGEVTVWSTPRRLALIARGLPEATAAVSEEVKGPKASAPQQALEGFLRKTGLTKDQLTERDGVYFAVNEKPGRATQDVLAEAIPAIIRAFPWPKSQRWGAASISTESLRWVRPLSGIVAIFGEELVACEVAGVRSGYATKGHRFHHPGEITIGGAADYQDKLRACHVIVDHAEREALIRGKAKAVAAAAGLELVEDEGLVVENAGLTEYPVPLLGRFDESFLEVPPEVIQLTAWINQKYFTCRDNAGQLANAFVCTANIEASDGGAAIVDGNRKVLAARLSDARFFWEQDRKKTLESHAEGLARVTFHEKLGTVADKVERVAKLARWLVEEGIVKSSPSSLGEGDRPKGGGGGGAASAAGAAHPSVNRDAAATSPSKLGEDLVKLAALAEQVARLCKADLVTAMVGEFPELQGVMGGYYARAEGLPDAVADAIRDHYKPVGQGDEVPTAPVTVAVSLADKLDTLAEFFVQDDFPTGSKDPFALRRAALGVIRLITENELRLSLQSAFDATRGTSFDQFHTRAEAMPKFKPLVDNEGSPAIGFSNDNRRMIVVWSDEKSYEVDLDVGESVFAEAYSKAMWGDRIADGSAITFFADRLKVQQREAGVRHDLIDAVFALGGEDDLVRLLARVQALQAFIGSPDGANLLVGYKRAANILKKEDWQPEPQRIPRTGEEDPLAMVDDPTIAAAVHARAAMQHALSYTPEPAERALIDALDLAEPKAAAAVASEDFAGAMAALSSLRVPIDAFFDNVTVNDGDPAKRAARLGLLARFRDAVHQVADFAKIEG